MPRKSNGPGSSPLLARKKETPRSKRSSMSERRESDLDLVKKHFLFVALLLGLLLLLADADAGHLVFVAGNAPLAVEVDIDHRLVWEWEIGPRCENVVSDLMKAHTNTHNGEGCVSTMLSIKNLAVHLHRMYVLNIKTYHGVKKNTDE